MRFVQISHPSYLPYVVNVPVCFCIRVDIIVSAFLLCALVLILLTQRTCQNRQAISYQRAHSWRVGDFFFTSRLLKYLGNILQADGQFAVKTPSAELMSTVKSLLGGQSSAER